MSGAIHSISTTKHSFFNYGELR